MGGQVNLQEWRKTPYAKSDATRADEAIVKLLDRYRISTRQWTEHPGPNGRPAVTLRFIMGGKAYRFGLETLNVSGADASDLMRQIKRAMYWHLKTTLENLCVFMPPEQALLPFLESATGETVYEGIKDYIGGITTKQLHQWGEKAKALPAPREGSQ